MIHVKIIDAYEDQTCIGLAILQPGFFSYLYLYDLKVSKDYRGRHIGQMLLQKASEVAFPRVTVAFTACVRTITRGPACFI